MKLNIAGIVAILLAAMIALVTLWGALETFTSADQTTVRILRVMSIAAIMTGLTAWLMLRYRRGYEDELRRQGEECLRTRVFFENIVKDAGEAVISLDNDGIIRTWNRAAEGIYGYPEAEIVGRPLSVLIPPDLLAAGEPDRITGQLRLHGCVRNHETRRLRKDGSTVLVRLTRSALHDGEGNVIGSSAIVSDITSETALEARVIHAEKLAAIGQAAASTAHEVRNALAGILGTVQILEKSEAWRQVPPDVGIEVHAQIARIDHIIDDLLAYARPGSLARHDTNVHEVLDRAIVATASSPDAAGRVLVRQLCAGSLMAEVDPQQLEQAFQNLILNAYQAMQPGGVLRIESSRGKDDVRVRFRDAGSGMTPDITARALEPFFTTKARGTGLGLAIVKTIVDAHHGTLEMDSRPDAGTTVTVALPRAAAAVEEDLFRINAA